MGHLLRTVGMEWAIPGKNSYGAVAIRSFGEAEQAAQAFWNPSDSVTTPDAEHGAAGFVFSGLGFLVLLWVDHFLLYLHTSILE